MSGYFAASGYEFKNKTSIANMTDRKAEILRLCHALHEFECQDIAFSGEVYRLFLISCCSRISNEMRVRVAVLEEAIESPVDIAGSYLKAANDDDEGVNENRVKDKYFDASIFANLREATLREKRT